MKQEKNIFKSAECTGYLAVFFFLILTLVGCKTNETGHLATSKAAERATEPKPKPKVRKEYGLPLDSFEVAKGTIERNQYLAGILLDYNVSYPTIDKMAKAASEVFDVRDIRANHPYSVFSKPTDTSAVPRYFVYEIDPVEYVLFSLQDSMKVQRRKKQVDTRLRTASATIDNSLYQTMVDHDLSPFLAMKMSMIYAWNIDFYRLKKGDRFKVLFQERYVKNKKVGLGDVLAVEFVHEGEMFEGYRFRQDSVFDYFNKKGESLRKAFRISPLKFSRITSHYSGRRYHPIQKRWKAHRGTDYAAPTGTPIMSTADGKVIASRYSRFNGNYVKVRHNSTYTTQYLHMSRRAVKRGDFVRQGEVIGYVGSTGLATGPHVCYRFWKNGRQVDHLKEDFPPSNPIQEENMAAFQQRVDSLDQRLNSGDTLLAQPRPADESGRQS